MLTVDCKDILPIQRELLIYVSDQVAAIPTLKNHQFTLSTFDDHEKIEIDVVITSIKEFLDSIGEGHNFAVICKDEMITISSVNGKTIERESPMTQEMFSCTHCGFVTRYQVEMTTHMRMHYL
ncbi:MAG: C2H2-type zinc finger protein [Nitrosopumilus sp.]|jgi:hypothetical protein